MLNAKSNIYDHVKASDLFTPLAYDESAKLFLCEDPSLAFGFLCNPLPGADSTKVDQLGVLLNMDFPTDTMAQFALWASPDIDVWLTEGLTQRAPYIDKSERSRLLMTAFNKQNDFFRESTMKPIESRYKTRARDMSVLVTFKIPLKGAEPTKQEYAMVAELQRSAKQVLETMQMGHSVLTAGLLTRVTNAMLNWGEDASWKTGDNTYRDDDMLKNQFLDENNKIGVDFRGVWLGDQTEKKDRCRVKILSPKRMPHSQALPETILYAGDTLTGSRGVRCPFLLCVNIHFPDNESVRASMETKKQWVTQQAMGPMLKFAPRLAAQKESFDVLFDAVADGDRLVRYSMSLALFENSEKRANAAASGAKAYFRERGFQFMEDRYFCLPLFLNMLPFGAEVKATKELHRYRTAAAKHVVNILPVCGDWKGTRTPLMQFVSRNGQIMNFDFYDSQSSFNTTVSAQSGSGKSFIINGFISNYLSMGGRVYTIDVGRSYQKLCSAYKGDFVEFTKESQLCLNPFPLVEVYEDDADMLMGLIASMASPTEKVTDFQTAGIRRHLRAVWDRHEKETSIDIISAALKSDPDQRIRDIGEQLYAFTTQGEYGRWFNGPNNMAFNNEFTVLELEELKGRKHLQQIVLLMIIYQIQDDMYRSSLEDRSRKRCIFIDEAWELLAEGQGGVQEFLIGGYRKARKYGGAFCVITQSVNDLYKSDAGVAIAENSPNMLLLGQKAETVENLKETKRLSLSDYEVSLLKSVHTARGVYSEIFFRCDSGSGVGRFIVPRFSQLVYTTHAEEVASLQKRMKTGMSLDEAINDVIRIEDESNRSIIDPLDEEDEAA